MPLLRHSPSGQIAVAQIVEAVGYTGATPLVLVLAPAGHQPGLYLVGFDFLIRIGASGGTFSRAYGYKPPTLNPISTGSGGANSAQVTSSSVRLAPAVTANVGGIVLAPQFLRSDGSVPITFTLTPVALTGSPVFDVYACATLIGI